MYLTLKVKLEEVPVEEDGVRALVRRVCSELHVEWLDLVLLATRDGRFWTALNHLEQLYEWDFESSYYSRIAYKAIKYMHTLYTIILQ